MLSIQKDLILKIILNRKHDWNFIFKNPVIQRPKGSIILMISVDYIKDISSRILIIQGKEDYHLICQIQIENFNEERLVDFENFVEYQQTCKKSGHLRNLDLDNPYYNSEWHFAITRPFWFSIVNRLKDITIPLYPSSIVHGNMARTICIEQNLNYLSIRWIGEDERYDEVKSIMDYLLNLALTKIDTAYFLRRYSNHSK